jgi:6-phosphogluconolactonase (cycloisomerase 2 family)
VRQQLVAALTAAVLGWSCTARASQSAEGLTPDTPQPGASGTFAYAAFSGDGQGGIAAYRVNVSSGALDHVATVPVEGPHGLVADATGHFFYTVSNHNEVPAEPVVVAYRIETTGALTEIGRIAAPTQWGHGGRVLAATDRFLYVLLDDSSTGYAVAIMVYGIGVDGTLKQIGYSGVGVSCCLQFFSLAAGGQSAFMDSGGSTRVMGFHANADGTLAGAGQAPTLGIPTAGALLAAGQWLLVGGYNASEVPYLATYAAGPGTLQGPVSAVTLSFVPQLVAADPRGRFAFTSNYESLASYRVDGQTGGVREAALIDFDVDFMAVEPGGRFLYVASYLGVTPFSINAQSGALRKASGTVRPPEPFSHLSGLAVVAVP